MSIDFEKLAATLAERDSDLPAALQQAEQAAERLRAHARSEVSVFRNAATSHGATHLANLTVGPLEPDEKRVDAVQFKVSRGRWQIVCVFKAKGVVTLVGPFRSGKTEKPCKDFPPVGAQTEEAFSKTLADLITAASER